MLKLKKKIDFIKQPTVTIWKLYTWNPNIWFFRHFFVQFSNGRIIQKLDILDHKTDIFLSSFQTTIWKSDQLMTWHVWTIWISDLSGIQMVVVFSHFLSYSFVAQTQNLLLSNLVLFYNTELTNRPVRCLDGPKLSDSWMVQISDRKIKLLWEIQVFFYFLTTEASKWMRRLASLIKP